MARLVIPLFFLALAICLLMAAPAHYVTLAWTWSQGTGDMATGFHIQRSNAAGGPYSIIATVPVGTLNYQDSAVSAGQVVYYVITAYNSGGDSLPSNEVSCTIPFQAPTAPNGLSGTVK